MKKIVSMFLCFSLVFVCAGCAAKQSRTKKLQDVAYTVLEEKEIPQELLDVIEEKKGQEMRMTYADKEDLYIVRGYGEQKISGYSMEVKYCYETANAIYLCVDLIGPAKSEKIVEEKTYPYVVVKVKRIDKNVVFE